MNDQLGEENLPLENQAVVPTRRWSVIPAVEECFFHQEKSCSVFLRRPVAPSEVRPPSGDDVATKSFLSELDEKITLVKEVEEKIKDQERKKLLLQLGLAGHQ